MVNSIDDSNKESLSKPVDFVIKTTVGKETTEPLSDPDDETPSIINKQKNSSDDNSSSGIQDKSTSKADVNPRYPLISFDYS